MKIHNARKDLFVALKMSIARQANRHESPVAGAQLGDETTLRVEETYHDAIFGPIPGSEQSRNQIEIGPHSIVDNRPETDDVVYFKHDGKDYRVDESRHYISAKIGRGGNYSEVEFSPMEQTTYTIRQFDAESEKWQLVDGPEEP